MTSLAIGVPAAIASRRTISAPLLMPISTGSRLGPYEVLSPLGVGGMGEVWKARDTRLDRSVAIKVLPAEFAENAQLKLRFEREAKTISQLNHPNICTLYDVGDGYLVMELLEGESLADKLAKGLLPIEQVLRYGIEIAHALQKAHKAGVVHRDLKPGNIMITKSGAKLLDFGLAKPIESGILSALTSLRTEQRKGLTEEGMIVGTFQYMAPEQIEGADVDARTDIFALGAVLYEMATGRHAFQGRSKASLIASILTAEPEPIRDSQPLAPATFDRVVRTCLAKEPDDRWQSAHDVAQQLQWIAEPAANAATVLPRNSRLAWLAAALATVAAIAFALLWHEAVRPLESPVQTLILPPENMTFQFAGAAAPPAISPDGKKIVFGAAEAGKPPRLWIRSLDSVIAQPLGGTDEAMFPFWSPDGRSIGFFAGNALKKMDVSGGAAIVLCNVVDGRGGSWSADGQTIIFGGRYTPIFRVSAAGGAAVAVTTLAQQFTTHRFPEFLPDGRHFLYLAAATGAEDPSNAICVGDVQGAFHKQLIAAANEPHYYDGNIIFTRERTLTAQRFDPKKLVVIGEPVPLKEQQIQSTANFAKSFVALAPDGTLLYQTGSALRESQLTWFDRSGKVLGTVGDPSPFNYVALSPDEKSVLVSLSGPSPANIWAFDLIRGVKSRVTFGATRDIGPVWSPDGRRMIYAAGAIAQPSLVEKDLTTGRETTLLKLPAGSFFPTPTSWSADGRDVLVTIPGRTTRGDVWWLSLSDGQQHPYIAAPFIENGARFSPDGKWVAYQSNESGTTEIYVAPFPPTGAKWQISTNGGFAARWRSDGKELFYVGTGTPAKLTAVPLNIGATPGAGQPVTLFSFHVVAASVGLYDVSRDGRRFLVNTRVGEEPPPQPLILMQHFETELRAALEHHN